MINPEDREQERISPPVYQIESMLRKFKPIPSQRFYDMTEQAPWMELSHERKYKFWRFTQIPRYVYLPALIIVLSLLSFALYPQLRVIARELLNNLFPLPTNQIDVQVSISSPGDLFHFSDPSNFSLSIDDAQEKAGFQIRSIKKLPENVKLVGAHIEIGYEAVIILYQGEGYQLFLTQRPVGNGKDLFTIGSNAVITLVTIGENQGEYVSGGWKAVSTQEYINSPYPVNTTNINAIWDNHLPQSTLRWQENGFSYELRSLGNQKLSQAELVILANELK